MRPKEQTSQAFFLLNKPPIKNNAIMKFCHYLIFGLLIFSTGCGDRNERLKGSGAKEPSNSNTTPTTTASELPKQGKIGKAIFYLENSRSMFGYVSGFTEYVDVVSDLAEKPRFAEERTPRAFYFVNGGGNKDISVTPIGDNPATLKNQLNTEGFECGDPSKSDLNAMFQLALSKAKNDTVSILISDAIYDIGKSQVPMNALSTKGRETRSRFIERLGQEDLQTIIVKLNSDFQGRYYPVKGGIIPLSQNRPFYVWIFGRTTLLNDYFNNEYLQTLEGFSNTARFLKKGELLAPYQATAQGRIGNFKFDKRDKNKLIEVTTDRNGQGFRFSIAIRYSALPLSDSYFTDIDNYTSNNPNFTIEAVSEIGDTKLYGLNFTPTHLLTVATNKNPAGQLEISLLNTIPSWIAATNVDDEDNIVGDSTHTFGFQFLTDAISEAYHYKNKGSHIVSFTFELTK